MRNVLPVCAGLVVISGIVSATMWSELRTERQLVADLRTQLADSNTRLQASLASQASQRNLAQQAPALAPVATVSDAKAASPVPPPPVQPVNISLSLQQAQAREQELMADPEYRKARMAQQRMNIERNFPGLVEELGLSQKEADRVFDILAESQMNMNYEMNALRNGAAQPDQATRAEMQRRQQEMQRQQEAEVAALLGPARYAQWQGYEETRGGRQQAVQFGMQLAQVGLPLSDVQQRGLTTVLVAEQKRLMQTLEPMARNMNQADAQMRQQIEEQAMKLQEESNRRIVDGAAAHLSARQVASLKQQFETQAAMTAAQRRLQQRRQEVQGGGGPIAVPVPAIAPAPSRF
jgi:hypothetical protein